MTPLFVHDNLNRENLGNFVLIPHKFLVWDETHGFIYFNLRITILGNHIRQVTI